MSDDVETGSGGSGDPGIFGSLPSSRPGTRSPRRSGDGDAKASKAKARRAERAKPAAARPAAEAKARQAHPPPPPKAKPKPSAGEPEQPGPKADDGQTGIEDLAWAGVAAAAEAATLGVRLATRALETVRRAAERP